MEETELIGKLQQFKKHGFYQSSSGIIILFALSYLLTVAA